jgi:hypothetical protein
MPNPSANHSIDIRNLTPTLTLLVSCDRVVIQCQQQWYAKMQRWLD